MKSFALALCALVVLAGAAPMALAQGSSTQSSPPSAAPSVSPPSSPSSDTSKSPSGKVDVDIKARSDKSDSTVRTDKNGDAAGAASPRTGSDVQRTGFFGLSPTAAIIVSVAVLLVVILAIVAMTHSSGGTYIDTDRRV